MTVKQYKKQNNNMNTNMNSRRKIQRGGDTATATSTDTATSGSIANIDNKQTELPPHIKRLPYDVKIFSFLCVMGILIRMIFAEPTKDYATATVYGYTCSILALFGLLVSSLGISYKDQASRGIMGFFNIVLKNAMPIILVVGILGLLLYQNMYFYKQINEGRVSAEYYSWSVASSCFILIQVAAAVYYMMDILAGEKNKTNTTKAGMLAAIASELSSLILILTVMNVGIIGILQVILKFFSTDG